MPSSSLKSAPVVPVTQCTPASRQLRALWSAASGVVKSTTTSASPSTSPIATPSSGSARPTSAMSSACSTARQTVSPIRPAAPETATLITSGSRQCRADRPDGVAEDLLVAAHARRAQPIGIEQLAREVPHVVERDRVDLRERLVERQQRDPHQECAPKPV